MERLAAFREFAPSKRAVRDLPREEVLGATFADRIRPFLVDELSDQFWQYYITDTHLVIAGAESGILSRAWERVKQAEPGAAADGGGM